MNDILKRLQLELDVTSRRLRGMAMIARGIVPNLVLSQRVVDKMTAAAQTFLADETGEAMVGLVVEGRADTEEMPTIYILDTISPDESAVREFHTFQQGDERQEDIFLWLRENWDVYRERGKDYTGKPLKDGLNVPLSHVGDWHKQPGFMIAPSGGDLMTALMIIEDNENIINDFLLVPIVTLGHPSTTIEDDALVNYITVPQPDGTNMRVDWWYIHGDVRMFQPIRPIVTPEEKLPQLPSYPWHLLDENRLNREVALLNQDGLFVSPLLWEATKQPPLDICFATGRQGAAKLMIIVTRYDFPATPPIAYLAPLVRMGPEQSFYDVFDDVMDKAERVDDPPGWSWTPEKTILEYIRAIEDHLGIPHPDPAPVQAVQVSGDDDDDDDDDDIAEETDSTREEETL